jgi:hypothetical protein
MSNYEKILTDDKGNDNIKDQYNKAIEYYNTIGNLSIPEIGNKDSLLGLLVFGYSGTLEDIKRLNDAKEILREAKIKHYCVGDMGSITKIHLQQFIKGL